MNDQDQSPADGRYEWNGEKINAYYFTQSGFDELLRCASKGGWQPTPSRFRENYAAPPEIEKLHHIRQAL